MELTLRNFIQPPNRVYSHINTCCLHQIVNYWNSVFHFIRTILNRLPTRCLCRIAFALILSLILLPTRPLTAQDDGALVRPDPILVEIVEGQIRTVNIVLEDAQDVYAVEVRASFDTTAVEVVDADPGRMGVQMTPGDFIQPDFVVRNGADNDAGTLQYVATQVNPTPPASGSGTLLVIQFRGKSLGEQTDLETEFVIDFIDIVDRRGIKLNVQSQNSLFRVVSQPLCITLGWFSTSKDGDVVDFRWQMATEMGTAGFNVLAVTDNVATQLNEELIPSTTIDSIVPTSYSFLAVTDATTFRLQEIRISGGLAEHGPFLLGTSYGEFEPVEESEDPEDGEVLWLPIVINQ